MSYFSDMVLLVKAFKTQKLAIRHVTNMYSIFVQFMLNFLSLLTFKNFTYIQRHKNLHYMNFCHVRDFVK